MTLDLLTNVATDLYNKVISNGNLLTKTISEISRVYLCIGLTWFIRGWGGGQINHWYYLLAYLLALLLTPWSRVFLEKLIGSELVKKLPAIYGTRRFITAFSSARHLSLPIPDRSSPFPHIPLLTIHLNIILHSTPGSPKLLDRTRVSVQVQGTCSCFVTKIVFK